RCRRVDCHFDHRPRREARDRLHRRGSRKPGRVQPAQAAGLRHCAGLLDRKTGVRTRDDPLADALTVGERAGFATEHHAMIIFAGLAFAALVVVALGGRLANLSSVELRGKAAIIGAFALQLLVITVAPLAFSHSLDTTIHLASYGLAIMFVYAN